MERLVNLRVNQEYSIFHVHYRVGNAMHDRGRQIHERVDQERHASGYLSS